MANLRAIGVEVWEVDPETGRQINYTACGGHFALRWTALALAFPESKEPHAGVQDNERQVVCPNQDEGRQDQQTSILGAVSGWNAFG